jgi:hypothetical protein
LYHYDAKAALRLLRESRGMDLSGKPTWDQAAKEAQRDSYVVRLKMAVSLVDKGYDRRDAGFMMGIPPSHLRAALAHREDDSETAGQQAPQPKKRRAARPRCNTHNPHPTH